MKFKLTLFFPFFFTLINAQNLVLNPSFEIYERCPEFISQFDRNIKDWSVPNYGTTDYFNTCSKAFGVINYNGKQYPKSGSGFAGFYAYSPENYREYIQGRLHTRLKKGEKYHVSFYVSLAENSTYSIKNLDLLFTSKEQNIRMDFQENIKIKRLKKEKDFSFFKIENSNYYDNKDKWIKVSFVYEALGFEAFFIIGNFNTNMKTEKRKESSLINIKDKFSYYYIDSVSVTSESNEGIAPKKEFINEINEEEEKPPLKANIVYTFKNVLFNFNETELLDTTIDELDKLFNYLIEYKDFNIEIYGHTDNVGTEEYNKKLSKNRAKVVSQYLIIKGLNFNRISWFGFGSSKPILENNSEQNRAKNRRVEFKLIDIK